MDENEDRVDLSALGPTPERYAQLVKSVSARGVDAVRARNSLPGQLARWARPVLAVAALAAVLGAVALTRPSAGTAPASFEQSLLGWSVSGHVPSGAELFAVTGGAP